MTHSPAPWNVFQDPIMQRWTIGTATSRICDMWGSSPLFYTAEDAANARLIAAAPDLILALKEWISMAIHSGLEGCDEILEQAEAAIDKATGGQEEEL
jgi:hypothetical protein